MGLQRRRWLAMAALGGGASVLGGCGFRLQSTPELPFARIALTGFAPGSPLERDLREALATRVQVVDSPTQADVVLRSLADVRQKSVVASTSASQVREVQLRVRLQFRVLSPTGRELAPSAELLQVRDLSYNETQALAKAYEEAQILRDMRSDIVQQVLRRLSALKL
jgi:LPS-assembly lipoprotein